MSERKPETKTAFDISYGVEHCMIDWKSEWVSEADYKRLQDADKAKMILLRQTREHRDRLKGRLEDIRKHYENFPFKDIDAYMRSCYADIEDWYKGLGVLLSDQKGEAEKP